MEVIHSGPDTSAFIPLSEHQSATPASFYNGPPVLHYHSSRSKIVVVASDLEYSAPLTSFVNSHKAAAKDGANTNGHTAAPGENSTTDIDGDEGTDSIVGDVQIWVTSEKLILFSSSCSNGLTIPYPTISLHAIQSLPSDEGQQGLYMQLISSSGDEAGGDGSAEDEDVTSVSLTIIPSPSPLDSSAPAETLATTQETTSDPTPTEATLLFTALSACSNLHPDPIDENEDDGQQNPAFASSALFQAGLIQPGSQTGDLPPPMPGSGGWITAENIGDYVDEEGNWIGGGDGNGADEAGEEENVDGEEATPLGPGAGTIRSREGDSEAAEGDETDETKWRRTS